MNIPTSVPSETPTSPADPSNQEAPPAPARVLDDLPITEDILDDARRGWLSTRETLRLVRQLLRPPEQPNPIQAGRWPRHRRQSHQWVASLERHVQDVGYRQLIIMTGRQRQARDALREEFLASRLRQVAILVDGHQGALTPNFAPPEQLVPSEEHQAIIEYCHHLCEMGIPSSTDGRAFGWQTAGFRAHSRAAFQLSLVPRNQW